MDRGEWSLVTGKQSTSCLGHSSSGWRGTGTHWPEWWVNWSFWRQAPSPCPESYCRLPSSQHSHYTHNALPLTYSTNCVSTGCFVSLQANKFLVDPHPQPLIVRTQTESFIQNNNFLKSSCHPWSCVHTTGDYSSDLYSSHLFYFCGFLHGEKLLKHYPYKCATWQVILTRNLLFMHCA